MENVCPDCITAHRAVAEHGFTPFEEPPREGVYSVDRFGTLVRVCLVHVILYPGGVRRPVRAVGV